MTRVVIVGGGLSGALAAIALARRRPEVDLLLIEQGPALGGNHIWSFFDTDVQLAGADLLGTIAVHRWPDHEIRFPGRERVLAIGYNSIRSADLDTAVQAVLGRRRVRLGSEVSSVRPDGVSLASGETIRADCVIDARGHTPAAGLAVAYQKFVGRTYSFAQGHGVVRPVIMDARVPQGDDFRFLYLLPFTPTELLIEDTYYSRSPVIGQARVRSELDAAAARIGTPFSAIGHEETGVLPVVLAGRLEALWPSSDTIGRLGMAGGFFHPTTGYSLPDAVRQALWLAGQQEFTTSAVGKALRARAARCWADRRFYRLLNRMLFGAARPGERHRVLEHFYRLPEASVSRFYSAELSLFDKVRILSGRPPVPLRGALAALWSEAA